MKKKILAVLLSAAMVAAMAMGCSSGGGTSAKADGEKAGKAEDMTFVVVTGYLNCDACGSGVAAAIEEKGMQDKVTFVAMDNLIEILDYVKTGTITATSSTLPQEQGMYAVLMAYQAAQGMPLPANVDTGIGRITADNIDEWIETVSAK